jgi:hypothetical protein
MTVFHDSCGYSSWRDREREPTEAAIPSGKPMTDGSDCDMGEYGG